MDNNELELQPNKPKFSLRRELMEWLEAVVFSLVGVVLVFTFVFRVVGVQGMSMFPTLDGEDELNRSKPGDRVIISHLFYEPQQGDIIVITQPTEAKKPIIKRIIATENQKIDIDKETGAVSVDDKVLDEPYINAPIDSNHYGHFVYPLTVPKGHVFVLGDNRNHSLDSRDKGVGMVDERYILGKAIFRIYPFKSFGGLYDQKTVEKN